MLPSKGKALIPIEKKFSEKGVLQFFQTNDDYIKYPWVNQETGKWTQDEFVEQQGLADVKKKHGNQRVL